MLLKTREEICIEEFKKINIEEYTALLLHQKFILIRGSIINNTISSRLTIVNQDNIGDWYKDVVKYHFCGFIFILRLNEYHSLIDYYNESKIDILI